MVKAEPQQRYTAYTTLFLFIKDVLARIRVDPTGQSAPFYKILNIELFFVILDRYFYVEFS